MELVTKARTWDRTLLLFSTEQPDFKNTLHCQDRCKIFFVTKGSGTVTKGDTVHAFAAGSLLFFTHNSEAQLHIDHPESFQCCGIYFAPTIINDDLTFDRIVEGTGSIDHTSTLHHDMLLLDSIYGFEQEGITVLTLSKSDFAALYKLFYLMHDQLHLQNDGYWPCRSRSYLIEILFSVQSLCTVKNLQGLPQPFTEYCCGKNNSLEKIISYMDRHLADKITLNDLERLFALNRNQINQMFHQGAGCTSMKYLLNLRMDLARSLLRNTELPQKEIALRCGFQDYGHFCKTFKRISQITPQDYRKSSVDYSSL